MAKSTLVPKEYQGNLPNCVIALNMASRMQADPPMVMQNLYIVHGRPGWSSHFLQAAPEDKPSDTAASVQEEKKFQELQKKQYSNQQGLFEEKGSGGPGF